uniref:Serine aminopeptidase S33 domain-containing protein n=1 Tax=Kalanchoe fedtschenkoi TaxID=63787 RepID=A0A7N0U753_KALFE
MEQCAKLVIRPRRKRYDADNDLLDQQFMLKSKWFQRKDIKITNCHGEVLQCSHYVPINSTSDKPLPCVIYCHGNSGSRVDANEAALILLPTSITVFTFDFSGSGLSDGDHVTLGWNEKLDLKAVVGYLREDKNVSLIGLWGRCMGAVTSLMYGAEDPTIAGMILDSPFSDLFQLMTELVGAYNISIVKYGVDSCIRKMRAFILRKANFDIMDLNTIKAAKSCYVPVLLAHATGDNLIRPHHSDRIFEAYAGEKKHIIRFEGGHNSPRPLCFFDAARKFFHRVMRSPEEGGGPVYGIHSNSEMVVSYFGHLSKKAANSFGGHVYFQKLSEVCSEHPMTKAQEYTNEADGACTSLYSSLTIAELSNTNCFEPMVPNMLAKQYFENSHMEDSNTPVTLENDEMMFAEAFMESLRDLETKQYDVVPTPNVDAVPSDPSAEDKSGVSSPVTGHCWVNLPPTSSC